MKKLLFVFAIGAFAACGNGNSGDAATDTTSAMNDTTTMTTDTAGSGTMGADTGTMSTPH